MRLNKARIGFTMVELMLSMSFIAVLLLSIAMLTIQMSGIYNNGLTLREANQAGQFLSSEVQRSLNQTYSNAVEYVSFPDGVGGRLCAGGTVYAWNYPSGFSNINAFNKIGFSSDVRFVKFSGSKEKYCQEQPSNPIWTELPSSATELLLGGNANIALHSFSFARSSVSFARSSVLEDETQTIYTVQMVVGTPSVGLVTEGNAKRCKAADKKDDEWCAVNEFIFTARSGNKEALGNK